MSGPLHALQLRPDGCLSNPVFLDDPHVAKVMALLNTDGEQARIVGGAVRNALIGLPPGDIDVTTTATPETVIARAKAKRMRVIPTGLLHGTVTVVVSGSPFEVTTLREDVEMDGRHAVVRFGRDFLRDALRRDFTINALSVDEQGFVHDYAGGLEDLAAGRVRFIGEAHARIREDYLRVLRFFRFSAAYALGPLDPAGLAASAAAASHLDRLSRERIRAELLKLLVAARASIVVAAMGETGVLEAILGNPTWPARFVRYRNVVAARQDDPDPILALAALALRTESDAGRLRDRLRLSNEERDRLLRLGAALEGRLDDQRPPPALEIVRMLFTVGRQGAVDAVTLFQVDSSVPPDDETWRHAARQAASTTVPSLPLSGEDVIERGIRSGPLVGQVLKHLQARWIRAGFPDQPAVLHRLLDEVIAAVRAGAV